MQRPPIHENLEFKRIREVARFDSDVVRRIDASGYGDWTEVRFRRTILHSLDIQARVVVFVGDGELWRSDDHTDWYGVPDMVGTLASEAVGTRRRFSAIREGVRAVLEISVRDRFHDLVSQPGVLDREKTEEGVAPVPRDWTVVDAEPVLVPEGVVYVVAAPGDPDALAFLETASRVLTEDRVEAAGAAVSMFFADFAEAGEAEAA